MRALLLLSTLLLSGCGPLDFLSRSQLEVLRDNRERWTALQIRNYDYEHRRYCFCPPELNERVRIEVRNGAVTRVVVVATGADVPVNAYANWPTIDEVFDQTERQFGYGYDLKITYDHALRFPAKVVGDIPRAIDDEFTLVAENLVRR